MTQRELTDDLLWPAIQMAADPNTHPAYRAGAARMVGDYFQPLVDRLEAHADGKLRMTDTQISAAEFLIKRFRTGGLPLIDQARQRI